MCYSQFFLTKLVTLGILFSTTVRTALVVKLLILDILFLNSYILAFRVVVAVVVATNLIKSDILSLIFLILALYTSFFYYITYLT